MAILEEDPGKSYSVQPQSRKARIENVLRNAREGRPGADQDLVRYAAALDAMPASGGGGCHSALLRVANIGRVSGVSPEDVAADLCSWVHGSRKVPRAEIEAAVRKAFSTSAPLPRAQHRRTPPGLMDAILWRGAGATEETLIAASPVKLDFPAELGGIALLERLYGINDKLFIGSQTDPGPVISVASWLARFEHGYPMPEFIIPNPLSGRAGTTKDGRRSYRADSCVMRFRFAVVEFDQTPLTEQIQFWAGVKLPVVALIHSGGKSIHGWVRADCADREEWERSIEEEFFDLLKPLGADTTCRNEARLSRFPGHFRTEKNQWQRLLYLAPMGRPVTP